MLELKPSPYCLTGETLGECLKLLFQGFYTSWKTVDFFVCFCQLFKHKSVYRRVFLNKLLTLHDNTRSVDDVTAGYLLLKNVKISERVWFRWRNGFLCVLIVIERFG